MHGNISLLWCQECMSPKNQNRSVGELLAEFSIKYEGVPLLNVGTLIMAAYPLFVYPQQAEFDKVDYNKISTDRFEVRVGTSSNKRKRFCGRIRNSLSHGNFTITDSHILFEDNNREKTDAFSATIKIEDFGKFINNFMFEAKKNISKK